MESQQPTESELEFEETEANHLKVLPNGTKVFEANGHKYRVDNFISMARTKAYRRTEIEAGYRISFKALYAKLNEVYELCNKQKPADIAVIVHDLMKGLIDIDKNRIYEYEFCALFINREGESVKAYDIQLQAEKIADWEAEGIDPSFFSILAATTMDGFRESYLEIFQTISERTAKILKQQ